MAPKYPNTPLALAPIFDRLRLDTLDFSFEWQLWKALFRTSQEQIDLLNTSAPTFFGRIQATLFQSIVLRASRLLDSPKTGGQDNLVLEQLLLASPADVSAELTTTMRQALAKAKSHAAAVKTWRHKYLAHRDLDHATMVQPPTDAEVKYDDIDSVLEAFSDYLNAFDQHFETRTTAYLVAGEVGHERLIRRLKDAKLYDTLPAPARYAMREGA